MLSIISTIGLSLISVGSRAGLNIIDRKIFGHNKAPIVRKNLFNNIAPLSIFTIPTAVVLWNGSWVDLIDHVVDIRVILFALLVQSCAYAFSAAFRAMTVPRVVVASKMPDIFIPLGLWLLYGENWGVVDIIFAGATVLACIPVIAHAREGPANAHHAVRYVFILVLAQALTAPVLLPNPCTIQEFVLLTFAILLWRCGISAHVCVMHRERSTNTIIDHSRSLKGTWRFDLGRGLVSVITQSTFFYVVAAGDPGVKWPILNSTALFATVGSMWILGEHPDRRELVAVVIILSCILARALIGWS